MALKRENRSPVHLTTRRCLLPIVLLTLFTCPGCYEHVVGGTGSYVQKTDVYEPNVDKDKGALEQLVDDIVGNPDKKRDGRGGKH